MSNKKATYFGPILNKDLKENGMFVWSMSPEWEEVKRSNTKEKKVEDLKTARPWYTQLKGKHGEVYPFSNDELAAYVLPHEQWGKEKRVGKKGLFGNIVRKLKKLNVPMVVQQCDFGEGTIRFPWNVASLRQVGELLKLRKRRNLTTVVRQARVQNMKRNRFVKSGVANVTVLRSISPASPDSAGKNEIGNEERNKAVGGVS